MKLSVIIPAYNEEKRIGATLETMLAYLKKQKYSWEILVVDDGSTDKTQAVVADIASKKIRLIANPGNKGKGYSVRHGMREAKGDFVLFSDADLSTPIEELAACFRYIDEADIVIGSRNMPMSNLVVKQPWLRSTLGKIFPFLVRIVLVPGIRDTQCGFKLYSQKAAAKIAGMQRLEGFAFDAEQLFLARKLGFSVKEIPVTWANDERSKVRIIRDSFGMLVDLFRVRLWWLTGTYRVEEKLNKE